MNRVIIDQTRNINNSEVDTILFPILISRMMTSEPPDFLFVSAMFLPNLGNENRPFFFLLLVLILFFHILFVFWTGIVLSLKNKGIHKYLSLSFSHILPLRVEIMHSDGRGITSLIKIDTKSGGWWSMKILGVTGIILICLLTISVFMDMLQGFSLTKAIYNNMSSFKMTTFTEWVVLLFLFWYWWGKYICSIKRKRTPRAGRFFRR